MPFFAAAIRASRAFGLVVLAATAFSQTALAGGLPAPQRGDKIEGPALQQPAPATSPRP